MTLLIKNGHLIDPKNNIDGIFDILLENNLISKEPSVRFLRKAFLQVYERLEQQPRAFP